VTIPQNMDAIHSMILNDWRISAKKVAETPVKCRERTGYVTYSQDFRHEKCLNDDQKSDQVLALQAILDQFLISTETCENPYGWELSHV
jgi:hypothetical protein